MFPDDNRHIAYLCKNLPRSPLHKNSSTVLQAIKKKKCYILQIKTTQKYNFHYKNSKPCKNKSKIFFFCKNKIFDGAACSIKTRFVLLAPYEIDNIPLRFPNIYQNLIHHPKHLAQHSDNPYNPSKKLKWQWSQDLMWQCLASCYVASSLKFWASLFYF